MMEVLGVLLQLCAFWGGLTSVQVGGTQRAIEGVVLDGTKGVPIRGALVSALLSGRDLKGTSTSDEQGRFRIDGLPLGRYAVQASHSGFSLGEAGRQSVDANADLFSLNAGDQPLRLSIRIWRYGGIEGRVEDPERRSLGVRSLTLLRVGLLAGRAQLERTTEVKSDALGAFHFDSVPPGKYLIRLNADVAGQPGTYYPGEANPDSASIVSLEIDEQRSGLVIVARSFPAFKVAGKILGLETIPNGQQVTLMAPSSAYVGEGEVVTSNLTRDGRFTFTGIRPGQYELRLHLFPRWPDPREGGERKNRALEIPPMSPAVSSLEIEPLPNAPTLLVVQSLAITDRDLDDLVLEARPAPVVRGRVVFDGTSPPSRAELPTHYVSIRPADGAQIGAYPAGRVEPDGSFRTMGMPPGPYYLGMIENYAGWFVTSVRVGGVEVAGRPFNLQSDLSDAEITLANRPTELQGAVTDSQGQFVTSGVLIFPADPKEWSNFTVGLPTRIRRTRSNAAGQFNLAVFPGEYLAVAVPEAAFQSWTSRSFIESVSRFAVRVTVREGAISTLDLRLFTGIRR